MRLQRTGRGNWFSYWKAGISDERNTTVAFCDAAIDIFVAHNLIPSHQHLDEDEVIEVEAWELKDLEEMIYTGKITDGKTIAALMAYGRKYRSVDKKDELV